MLQKQQPYRQSMQSVHQCKTPPDAMSNGMPACATPPAVDGGTVPQLVGRPNPRMNPNNRPGGMMPPPSSAANGPRKDQGGPPKDNKGVPGHRSAQMVRHETRPQTSSAGSHWVRAKVAPPTPPTPNTAAPSPSAILNGPLMSMSQPNHAVASLAPLVQC